MCKTYSKMHFHLTDMLSIFCIIYFRAVTTIASCFRCQTYGELTPKNINNIIWHGVLEEDESVAWITTDPAQQQLKPRDHTF